MQAFFPPVRITREVYDYLFIDVPSGNTRGLEYSIHSPEGEMLRKGCFRGLSTQLRLTHLPEGQYFLKLESGPEAYEEYQFVKRNPEQKR
ncbi:MAG: hypothetical protein IAE96_13245 [Chitinophagaceae bacterium]|nr:hypothetical protein [Chitinophagaceae bacterium]